VPRRAVVPGAITGSAALTSLVAAAPIYKGEQITLRQFGPVSQGGVFAKFSGVGRIVAVPGDQNQLLAGTMSEGDRVDVVATAKYHFGQLSRSTTRVVLRNLLVVKAPNAPSGQPVASGTPSLTAQLVMTDKQAQIMGWVMKNATWFLALRPTKQPRDGAVRLETLQSVLGQGLPKDSIAAQIAGAYPESVDDGN
jgi:Flp pilus assembly protein CpaB